MSRWMTAHTAAMRIAMDIIKQSQPAEVMIAMMTMRVFSPAGAPVSRLYVMRRTITINADAAAMTVAAVARAVPS